MGVAPMPMDGIPLHLQHHSLGVSHPFRQLLQKVARAMLCYHDTHDRDDKITVSPFCTRLDI
jgi:hypothetical protein